MVVCEMSPVVAKNLSAFEAAGCPISLPAPSLPRDRIAVTLRAGAPEAEPAVQVSDGRGGWLRLHSDRDPRSEAERWLDHALAGREMPPLVVLIGAGLGYLIDTIAQRSASSRILVLEPEPELIPWLLARQDYSTLIAEGRLRVLSGPAWHGTSAVWSMVDPTGADPTVIVHPVIERARRDEVGAAQALLSRMLYEARANQNARERFAGRYILNTLRNLPVIAREGDTDSLAGLGAGVPVVLVAAGPSVDRHLPTLKRIAGRALIISVDTALRPLLAAGITPNMAVATDPSDVNARHLMDLPACPDTWLVAEPSLPPAVFAPFAGRTLLFRVSHHQPWPWLSEAGLGRGSLRAWGSVLTSAFDLAVRVGCNPIVFCGADLAYTARQTYCRGTAFEEDWAQLARSGVALRDIWEDGIGRQHIRHGTNVHGRDTITTPQFVAFRDWLIDRMAATPDRRFINATGDGLLHGDSIEQASLECVVAHLESSSARIGELLQAVKGAHRETADRVARHGALLATRVLDATRSGHIDEALPLNDWSRFAGAAVPVGDIAEAARQGALAIETPGLVLPELTRTPLMWSASAAIGRAAAQSWPYWARLRSEDLPEIIGSTTPEMGRSVIELLDELPVIEHRLDPALIAPESGACFTYRFRTNAGRIFAYSELYLRAPVYEDGQLLPHANSMHDDIRALGGGRYSMWPDAVFFSTSDGSDPRTNGRRYTIPLPFYLHFLEDLPQDLQSRFCL